MNDFDGVPQVGGAKRPASMPEIAAEVERAPGMATTGEAVLVNALLEEGAALADS